jgi:trehalose-6-phosphate synthase
MDTDFEGRVFVVANRLPITIKPQNDGGFEFSMSSGGLVSGIDVHRNDKDTLRKELQDQFNAVPIFLTKDQADGHYNGFSSQSKLSFTPITLSRAK